MAGFHQILERRKEAAETLAHYFKTAFEAAGIPWGPDNYSEIERVIDCLTEIADILVDENDKKS